MTQSMRNHFIYIVERTHRIQNWKLTEELHFKTHLRTYSFKANVMLVRSSYRTPHNLLYSIKEQSQSQLAQLEILLKT